MTQPRFSSLGLPSLLCLGAWACSGLFGPDAPHDPRMTTDSPSYATTDTIRVTVENLSDMTIEFDWCDAKLERGEHGDWTKVPTLPQGAVCTGSAELLDPRAQFAASQPIFDWMATGTYRFQLRIIYHSSGNETALISNEFHIDGT